MLRTRLRSPRQGHRCASGSCLRGCAPVFRPATYHRASCSPLHRRASTDLDLHPAHCAIVPLAMGRESKRITSSIKQGTCETINILVVLKVRQIYAPLGSPETGHHSLARHYPDGGQRFYGSGDSQSWAERPRRQRCWRVVPQRSWSACRSVPSPGWAKPCTSSITDGLCYSQPLRQADCELDHNSGALRARGRWSLRAERECRDAAAQLQRSERHG